jgi:hypothetical protein
MSGGGYNYLYNASLSERDGDIRRMAKRLRELGHHDAALRTEEAAEHLRSAEKIRDELESVWHQIEWIDSGDCSLGAEARALEQWRFEHRVDPARADVAARLYRLELEAAELRAHVARMGRIG